MTASDKPVRVKYNHPYVDLPQNGMEGTIISGSHPRYLIKWDNEARLASHWSEEPFNISVLEIISD